MDSRLAGAAQSVLLGCMARACLSKPAMTVMVGHPTASQAAARHPPPQALSAGGTFIVHELGPEGTADAGPSFTLQKSPCAAGSWLLTLKPSVRHTFDASLPADAASGTGSEDAGSSAGPGAGDLLTAVERRAVQAVASAVKELGGQPHSYMVPSSSTFPGIDSILLPRMLFQVGWFLVAYVISTLLQCALCAPLRCAWSWSLLARLLARSLACLLAHPHPCLRT